MQIPAGQSDFATILEEYEDIYVIVSPPRCSSTAFARVYWEQPSIRFYSHEPFEGTYFLGEDLPYVVDNLRDPLDLTRIKNLSSRGLGHSLVIKEMPYQAGENFPLLISLTKKPVVFLTRDPRQNIASRMAKKKEVGDNPLFPLIETGWELISAQIKYCKDNDIPYLIVDARDFRNRPELVFKQVFSKMELPFDRKMLSWQACPDAEIDNLNGQHDHLYQQVLSSTGILPDRGSIPPIDSFPKENGYRDHVRDCLRIYDRLLASSARIRISSGRPRQSYRQGIYTGD